MVKMKQKCDYFHTLISFVSLVYQNKGNVTVFPLCFVGGLDLH